MPECRAAIRYSQVALLVAILAFVYATWYLPGLVKVLNKLSNQVEAMNERTAGRD